MDLLKEENIKRVFKEFVSNPSVSWVPVYNALTKNYKEKKSLSDDNFVKLKNKWIQFRDVFKNGYEIYSPSESNPGFYHVKYAAYDDSVDRKHRIYINPSIQDRLKFVEILTEECLKNNINFYFKYSRGEERCDNLLIYATEDELKAYAQVLKNIETNYPLLVKRCESTPLSATSLGWFAYGPEDKSNEKGSLSSRTAKIVRTNITKLLVNNRNLYKLDQIEKKDIERLFKACIESHSSKLETNEEKDVYNNTGHERLKESFIKNSFNICKFILSSQISETAIKEDKPLFIFTADNGENLEITPAAVGTMLAGLKPNFVSSEQRDDIYRLLQEGIVQDVIEENLNTKVPNILQEISPVLKNIKTK